MAETIRRIFVVGAPGSMWSGVGKGLRKALQNADNTDITLERIMVSGKTTSTPNHIGAYFNPGNEFDNWILGFGDYTKEEIIEKLDSAFNPTMDQRILSFLDKEFQQVPDGKNLIKIHLSHYFAYHLDKIRDLFPDACIVIISQEPHKSYVWWEHCGGHDTKYDAYYFYERDFEAIWNEIVGQSSAIEKFLNKNQLPRNIFNLEWVRKNFEIVSNIALLSEYTSEKDGMPRLQECPGNQTGILNSMRVSIINPWIN